MARGAAAWMRMAAVAMAAAAGGCSLPPPEPPPVAVRIVPAYAFALNARYDDIRAMLGHPNPGPRFDRYSRLTVVTYRYPFRAIQAETRFPNGTVRSELVSSIHLYFDDKGTLLRMSYDPNPYYPSFIGTPVDRITVLPRMVYSDGRVTPVEPPL